MDRAALVTGGSRGVGAATVLALVRRGVDVAFTYRSRRRRAEQVVARAAACGRDVLPVQCDLTDLPATGRMLAEIGCWRARVDVLVLNASGGLEQDLVAADPDYPMRINRDAQVALVEMARPVLARDATVVLVTSHWAHLYGRVPQLPAYEPVARSKHAGESALRELLAEGRARLVVVTGDLVEGTVTPKLLERVSRGLVDRRQREAGRLPTADGMGEAIAAAALDPTLPSGHTVAVGADPSSLLRRS